MQRLIVLALVFLGWSSAPLGGQPFVILDDTQMTGFLAPAGSVGSIRQQLALNIGVGLGLMIDHTTVVGIEAYGLVSDVRGSAVQGVRPEIDALYGNLLIEEIGKPDCWIHPVLRLAVGGGGVRFKGVPQPAAEKLAVQSGVDIAIPLNQDPDPWDGFFFIAPGAGAEIDISGNLRLELAASYRFVTGVSLTELRATDLGGASLGLMMKFGSF